PEAMPRGYTTSTRFLGSPLVTNPNLPPHESGGPEPAPGLNRGPAPRPLGSWLPTFAGVTVVREGRRNMTTAIRDDMFTPDVIADPYTYYGRLRDEDPIHWNDTYALWVITRHDDVTWMTRHNELFSSAVFRNDPRPAYPAIDESDLGLYGYVRNYQADQFIQHDRPEHLDMRKIVHGYFTPKAMESWRPFVVNAVKELLDAAEEKGSMDVMRDLATPLPVLVIAQMMGVPA